MYLLGLHFANVVNLINTILYASGLLILHPACCGIALAIGISIFGGIGELIKRVAFLFLSYLNGIVFQ